jgi:hypothetical protein
LPASEDCDEKNNAKVREKREKREKRLMSANSGRFFGFSAGSLVPGAKGEDGVQATEGE